VLQIHTIVSKHSELLARLVSINSINPDLVPGAPGEAKIARFVATWLAEAGLDVATDEAAPNRPSVVAIARGKGGGRSLMLNAHMDTVGVAGMQNPHTPRIEGNRLYGRGAYDMKGSLAAIMLAGEAAVQLGLRGDVIITAVCDEEFASIGTAHLLKRWTADAAIVTEPTGLDICIAHKGFAWFDIETEGVAAHGSKPYLGVDAIAKMGKIIVAVEQLDQQLRSQAGHHLLGTGSMHCSLISGGQELSSYPARCKLQVERRTIPGEIRAEIEAQIHAFAPQARLTMIREPFEINPDAAIVQSLKAQVPNARMFGDTPWMDAALTSAAGIPTVVFGPGGAGAHATVEYSNLDDVERAAAILTAVAVDFCR
jgi:acetylornithine deacetylase